MSYNDVYKDLEEQSHDGTETGEQDSDSHRFEHDGFGNQLKSPTKSSRVAKHSSKNVKLVRTKSQPNLPTQDPHYVQQCAPDPSDVAALELKAQPSSHQTSSPRSTRVCRTEPPTRSVPQSKANSSSGRCSREPSAFPAQNLSSCESPPITDNSHLKDCGAGCTDTLQSDGHSSHCEGSGDSSRFTQSDTSSDNTYNVAALSVRYFSNGVPLCSLRSGVTTTR